MVEEQLQYRAYLLRLWQMRSGGRLVWRASLEDPHTGERRGFASFKQLVAFLDEQTSGATEVRGDPDIPRGP